MTGYMLFYSSSSFCRYGTEPPSSDPALVTYEMESGGQSATVPVINLYAAGEACGSGTRYRATHIIGNGQDNPFGLLPITEGGLVSMRAVAGNGSDLNWSSGSDCYRVLFPLPNYGQILWVERYTIPEIASFDPYPSIAWYQTGYPIRYQGRLRWGSEVNLAVMALNADGGQTWTGSFIANLPPVPLLIELDERGALYGRLTSVSGGGPSLPGVTYTRDVEEARALRFVLDGEPPPLEGDTVTVIVSRMDLPEVAGSTSLVVSPPLLYLDSRATPSSIRVGEASVLSGVARTLDEEEYPIDDEREFNVWAWSEDGEAMPGFLVNDRTGLRDSIHITATYADLEAGWVRFVADTSGGGPTLRAPGAPELGHRGDSHDDAVASSDGGVGRARPSRRPRGTERASMREGNGPSAALASNGHWVYIDIETGDYTLSGNADLFVRPENVEVRLLRQNDDPIPVEGDSAAVMVSKVPTDWQLDNLTLPFEVPTRFCDRESENEEDWECEPYEHYDPYTFRPEVSGLEAGKTVRFCVEVVQDGQSSGCGPDALFSGVEGVREVDQTVAYRGTLFLRLVSNAADDGTGTGQHAHEARQTLRVRLGDVVRVTAQVERDGAYQNVQVTERTVGRLGHATETGLLATRRVDLRWHVRQGLPVQPEATTVLLDEHWAQAAIHFASTMGAAISPRDIRNALRVSLSDARRGLTRRAGTVTVTVRRGGDPVQISLAYAEGMRLNEVADGFSDQLRQAGILSDLGAFIDAFPAQTANESEARLVPEEDASAFYLVIGGGTDVQVTDTQGSRDVALRIYRRGDAGGWRSHDLMLLALHVNDADDGTADVIVLPNGSILGTTWASQPGGKGLGWLPRFPARARHTMFLTQSGAGGNAIHWVAASHEMGHVLGLYHYGVEHDEDRFKDAFDDGLSNLMWPQQPTEADNMSGPKRLTPVQHYYARVRSVVLLHPDVEERGNGFVVASPLSVPYQPDR